MAPLWPITCDASAWPDRAARAGDAPCIRAARYPALKLSPGHGTAGTPFQHELRRSCTEQPVDHRGFVRIVEKRHLIVERGEGDGARGRGLTDPISRVRMARPKLGAVIAIEGHVTTGRLVTLHLRNKTLTCPFGQDREGNAGQVEKAVGVELFKLQRAGLEHRSRRGRLTPVAKAPLAMGIYLDGIEPRKLVGQPRDDIRFQTFLAQGVDHPRRQAVLPERRGVGDRWPVRAQKT
jgi:hypothetical protein